MEINISNARGNVDMSSSPASADSTLPPPFEVAIAADLHDTRDNNAKVSSIQGNDYIELTVKSPDHKADHEISKPFFAAKDGVFANLSAKPEIAGTGPATDAGTGALVSTTTALPPSYNEVIRSESVPSYFEAVVVDRVAYNNGDELLLDGMPVGSIVSFLVNCFVAYVFDLVGFLFCFVFSITHASRNGSICGLGLTLIRHGTIILARVYQISGILAGDPSDDSVDYGQDDSQFYRSNMVMHQVIAYFCISTGLFIAVGSVIRYYRAQSLLRLANTTSAA